MVIKSYTLNELRKNATYSRQYAAALIAHADRIEALIDAEAMVADIGASQTPAEPARTEAPAEPARTEPAAEPARTEAPAENFRTEPPAEPARSEPPAEPSRTETPAETPRFDAPLVESPRAEAPVEAPRVNVPPNPFTRLELPKPARELGVTQADAIKTALGMIGRPASLSEIFNTIKSQRIPVKLTSAENLRLVMSRSDDFESNQVGQWQLKMANSAPEFGQASQESPEFASVSRG